ncbi:MAG: DEAD/DEAH box helicase [Candidatus Phaeomarinobacter sp.]
MTFDEFGLNADLLKAINESGYTEPTPIQAQAIPKALADRDVLGIAQTGTGKTASFTLPMIERLSKGRAKARMPRSLILEPTRELAAQVAENFEKYGKYHKLSMALLIGGVSFGDQDKKIDRGVDVLIATPGRLLDHVERGKLMLTGVQTLVIDEADRMLDMGFIPDIERICKLIPFTRQTMLFSATMPPEIENLANNFMQAPARIEVARASTTNKNITQRIITCGSRDKRKTLIEMIDSETIQNAIIFCNRKRDVDVVARALKKAGLDASPIHGDLDQSVRTQTLGRFRDGELKLLVASDVAARGLDIPEVSHVFNYDVPTHPEDYVHRIGRTGRAGRDGAAFTLVTPDDKKYLDAVEKLTEQKIERWTRDEDAPTKAKEDEAPAEEATPEAETSTGEPEATSVEASAETPEVTSSSEASSETDDDASTDDADGETARAPRRGRRRGGRGRGRNRRAKDADATETADAASEADSSAETDTEEQPDVEPRAPRGRGRRRGGSGANGGGRQERVIGMGDHVPAFILRPIRPAKAAAEAAAAAEQPDAPVAEVDSADETGTPESDAA